MKTQIRRLAVLALALAAASAAQADMQLRIDCAHRALPGQAALAEGLGIANFDQAYQARVRLASVVNRECQRQGRVQVQLVLRPGPAPEHVVVQVARR